MEKGSSRRKTTQQQSLELEKKDDDDEDDDVVLPTELMHRIQSLLSEKEAARTCVLSKSWLHAWSTTPNPRFPNYPVTTNLIYNTVQRYHDRRIPIEALNFFIKVVNLELDEVRIGRILAPDTRRSLKELSLTIWGALTDSVFTFSDDLLFSGHNLQKIYLGSTSVWSRINPGINPVIKCVFLRVLELRQANVSADVFHNLLSTCSLLEEVVLYYCQGLKTIKVKNLGCLRRLEITSSEEKDGLLEIDNVPSLAFFYYKSCDIFCPLVVTDTMASSLGRSVTRLHLEGTIIDEAFFDMIKLKFPFLESLELEIRDWVSERLVITSLSLKRLALRWACEHRLVEVYAPNLLSFVYDAETTLPTLLFPVIAPKEIKLSLKLWNIIPLDTSFFLELREVLNLSSTFDIHITIMSSSRGLLPVSLNDDYVVDDLRCRQVSLSDANVQQLSLTACSDDCPWEGTRFFDALFSICHPVHVKVSNHFISQRTVSGMMENNTTDLKEVLMKNPLSGRWEALASSWETDFLDSDDAEFKLNWFSHN